MIICMVGLVWVMEWTSVLVIILRIPKKKNKNRQTKYRKTNREGRVTKDYKVSCLKFIVPIVLKTN